MTDDDLREANGLLARYLRLGRILTYIPTGQATDFLFKCTTPEGNFLLPITPAETQEYITRELARCRARLTIMQVDIPDLDPPLAP